MDIFWDAMIYLPKRWGKSSNRRQHGSKFLFSNKLLQEKVLVISMPEQGRVNNAWKELIAALFSKHIAQQHATVLYLTKHTLASGGINVGHQLKIERYVTECSIHRVEVVQCEEQNETVHGGLEIEAESFFIAFLYSNKRQTWKTIIKQASTMLSWLACIIWTVRSELGQYEEYKERSSMVRTCRGIISCFDSGVHTALHA